MSSQTQIFEWVKDGNLEGLQTHFNETLKGQRAKIRKVFNLRDNLKRGIIHWAAYLGQDELLGWWLSDYIDLLTINFEDCQKYTPLELAAIRGYSDDYDADQQLRTVQLLLDYRAKIKVPKNKPCLLHWAFYYCNIPLIELLILKDIDLIYAIDDNGFYPIDYLFFENKSEIFKRNVIQAFILTVEVYIKTTNKNRRIQKKIENQRRNNFLFEQHNSTSWLHCEDDPKHFNFVDIEPPNAYTPNIYSIRINSSRLAMKFKTFYKPNSLRNGKKKIISKQIQNVILSSQESIHGYSEERMASNKSEPEEEKFPPIILQYDNQARTINLTNYESKNKTETKKQISNISNFNHSETPISKLIKDPYDIYQLEKSMKNQNNHLETRFLYWSAASNLPEFVIYFLERKCSPFMINYQGANAMHAAAANGHKEILKIFLESDYKYVELSELLGKKKINKKIQKKYHFDKQKCIDQMTTLLPSTALHLAIENDHYECARLLIRNDASTQLINHRTLRPFELKINQQIKEITQTYYKIKPFNEKSPQKSRDEISQTDFVSNGFYYVIQTPGKMDVSQDIVYIQLQNIVETFKKKGQIFEFLILYGPDIDHLQDYVQNKTQPEFFFYVIKLSHDIIYYLAERNELQCFNFKKKFICQFKYEDRDFFEFPKDLQIQTLITNTLNEEFDLDNFLLEGLIVSHFPLEDRRKTNRILLIWKDFLFATIRDTVRIDTDQIALRPLHALSNYYGPVIGWYFAFIVQMIGWLSGPSILGMAIGIYMMVAQDYQSKIIPIYALFMALWATLFIEKWKNRTWELRFSWDMHNFKANEPQRVMYTGQYTLDSIKNNVCIQDQFTTSKRRIFTDIPIILFGILMIVALFWGFLQWSQMNQKNQIASILIGSLNGASITILSSVYKYLCQKLVQWENHRFESEQEFSYIIKVYLFEFLNSYITVVYYAIFEEDPLRLAVSVGSIVITRGVIQNVTSNGVPFVLYQIKSRFFRKKFRKFTELVNQDMVLAEKIGNQNYLEEKISDQSMVELLTQVEESIIKQPQKLLFDEYTSIAIQFGYITMFSPSFPAAPIFFMISMFINLCLSLYSYRNIMKRERSLPADSIGIWENIFIIMNYAATFMNCIVIARANKSQLSNLVGKGTFIRDVAILVATEHIILLIKYILEITIPDIPAWVERELKRYDFFEKQTKV